MSFEEPTATIKITFDELPPDAKLFLFIVYILFITITLYLHFQLLDRLYSLYKTRHYQSISN
jgi:hypothetical protein